MIHLNPKIAIIATLAEGFLEGFRACEEKHGIPPISDSQLVSLSVDYAAELYQENQSILENQGIYHFALPKS